MNWNPQQRSLRRLEELKPRYNEKQQNLMSNPFYEEVRRNVFRDLENERIEKNKKQSEKDREKARKSIADYDKKQKNINPLDKLIEEALASNSSLTDPLTKVRNAARLDARSGLGEHNAKLRKELKTEWNEAEKIEKHMNKRMFGEKKKELSPIDKLIENALKPQNNLTPAFQGDKPSNGFLDNALSFLKGEKKLPSLPDLLKGNGGLQEFEQNDKTSSYNAIGKVLPGETPNEFDRFLARSVNTASLNTRQAMTNEAGQETYYNNREFGEGGGTDLAADMLGYLMPGTLAVKGLRAAGLGAKTLPKLGEGATRGQQLTRGLKQGLQYGKEGALVGAGIGLAETPALASINPEQGPLDHLKRMGLETTIGAVADPALMGAGAGLSKLPLVKNLIAKLTKGEISKQQFDEVVNADPQLKKELLLLPEGQKLLPEPINPTVERMKFDFDKSVDVPEGLALPEGKQKTVIPARKVDYSAKLDALMDEAKKQNLTPGREREVLESLWSQMAGPNDPSLDELIRLGTPSLRSLELQNTKPLDLLKKAKETQSKSAYGLDTTFNKLPQTKQFETTNNLGDPLPFKREAYNIKTPEQLAPQNFVGQTNQLKKTKVGYTPPEINDNLLNSLEYGDKVKVRSGRGEVELSFVKREEDQVVVKRNSGKETVIPASMVNGRVDTLRKPNDLSKREVVPTLEAPLPKIKPVNSLVKESDLPKAQAKNLTSQNPKEDLTKLKDISGFKAATNDVYRNFRDVFGNSASSKTVEKNILEPLEQSKVQYVQMQKDWTDKLKTEIVDRLGIKKGSKESALVQQYGEKEISLEELKKKAPDKWNDIVNADGWFRKAYDELIDTVNASRAKIYPNNPDKLVPKREDYYRHFNEFTSLTGLKNIFDTPGAIDPHLAGTSQYTKPKTKFAGFMQKRGMGPYKRDAVGGFLEYIPAASYATNIDANIPRLRAFKNQLADATEDSKNINNFLEFIDNYANDLAGKTNPYFDRNIQSLIPGGRKTFSAVGWLNNRVKSNVILGNVSSALAQTANVPLGIAFAKTHSVNGFKHTVKALFDEKSPIYQSNFLRERYSQELYRRFDERLIEQPKKMAEWMIETADRVGTSFVWNSAYEKGLKEKVKDPIKFADENTRRLVAGRGVGEVPLLQKAKTIQVAMPFTLEVGNLWRVMGDMKRDKDVTGLMTLFVANFILNKGIEELRGFDVTFDPIAATIEALSEEDITPLQRAGRVAGEALTNLPSGQFLANLYPERGKVGSIQGPTRQELFGDKNPQRFGTGLVASGALTDPLFKAVTPFGGNQIKKTLGGLDVLSKEAAYKKGTFDVPFLGDYKEMTYPVEQNLENNLKSIIFGSSALDETKEYYDNKRKPLSENQTNIFKQAKEAGLGDEYYEKLMTDRRVKTLKSQMTAIQKDEALTPEEKQEKLMKLVEKLKVVAEGVK